MLGEIEDGQYAVRAGTVGDLCEKWGAQAEPDLSPSVAPEYRRLLDSRILLAGARSRFAGSALPTSTSGTPSCAARARSTVARWHPTR